MSTIKSVHLHEPSESEQQQLKEMLSIVGDRWTAIIMWQLKDGPTRFTGIKNMCGINAKTLTQRLLRLENFGLVEKKEFNEYPPRVEYSLTSRGNDLLPVFEGLMQWAQKYLLEHSKN